MNACTINYNHIFLILLLQYPPLTVKYFVIPPAKCSLTYTLIRLKLKFEIV